MTMFLVTCEKTGAKFVTFYKSQAEAIISWDGGSYIIEEIPVY